MLFGLLFRESGNIGERAGEPANADSSTATKVEKSSGEVRVEMVKSNGELELVIIVRWKSRWKVEN